MNAAASSYPGNIPGQVINTGQPPGYYVVTGQGQGPPGQPMMYSQPPGMMMNYNMQAALQRQMVPVTWMDRPSVPGCPPGLEYLTKINELLVKQRMDVFEMITGYEVKNKYEVKNSLGQTIYFAKEDTGCCEIYWCCNHRKFKIHIYDNADNEVIEIKRQDRCHRKACVRDMITVQSPPGKTVGYVSQDHFSGIIRYTIMDDDKNVVLRIIGPACCHCYCPGDDVPFKVMSADDRFEIGKISKQWSHTLQEYLTDADNFGIQFPIDLDVKIKAVILGAVFLIDFNFFERTNGNRRSF